MLGVNERSCEWMALCGQVAVHVRVHTFLRSVISLCKCYASTKEKHFHIRFFFLSQKSTSIFSGQGIDRVFIFSSVSQKWLNILENASLREFSIWNGRDGSQTKEAINVDNKNKVMRRLQPEPWLMLWIHALQVFAMNTYLNTTRPVPRISSKCRTFPVFSVMMAETDACRLQCFVHPDFWRVCWIFGHIAGEFTWSRTGFKEINSAFCPKSPAFLQKTK